MEPIEPALRDTLIVDVYVKVNGQEACIGRMHLPLDQAQIILNIPAKEIEAKAKPEF